MDLLADIEKAQAQRDLGVIAVRVFQGARSEGSLREAFWATVAFLVMVVRQDDVKDPESDADA